MIIKENMGLTSWKGAPDSKIHKYDVVIAKNEMFKDKVQQLIKNMEKTNSNLLFMLFLFILTKNEN